MENKLQDWKNRLKDRHMLSIVLVIVALLAIVTGLSVYVYKKQNEYHLTSSNAHNASFYELVKCMEDVEVYLAKASITSTPEHAAKMLSRVWDKTNLASVYLSGIPIRTEGLSNTARFLNQAGDYCYSLSMKAIDGESLTDDELQTLEQLHDYSLDLRSTLDQLESEINEGTLNWNELDEKGGNAFAQQVSTDLTEGLDNIETTFDDYTGLIYDGAFSEHMVSPERKGLTGDDIGEAKALEIAKTFIDTDQAEITSTGLAENGNIPSYNFEIGSNDDNKRYIAISKKGGHLVYMNYYREIGDATKSPDEAVEIGKEYLSSKGYSNMQETYYMEQNGNVVVNYAYETSDGVLVYSDLIKVKVALDNGEVLGVESVGYLNCHEDRSVPAGVMPKQEAAKAISPRVAVSSGRLAVVPTEYNTEILCWEFTAKAYDRDCLIYINAQTGKEENILMIIGTPNGTLTS